MIKHKDWNRIKSWRNIHCHRAIKNSENYEQAERIKIFYHCRYHTMLHRLKIKTLGLENKNDARNRKN